MTMRRAFGFETDITFITSEVGIATSGTITVDSTVHHNTVSGYGGAKSLKMNGTCTFKISGAGGVADELHFALFHSASFIPQASIVFTDSGATVQASISFDSDGLARIRRGAVSGGTLLATSAGAFTLGVWNTWKVIVTCREAASAGRIQVFLNGSASAFVDTGAGVDTRASSTDDFAFVTLANTGSGLLSWWDDFVWASTGVIPDEPLYIVKLTPTSDGTVQFTHSTGASNFGTVDEDPVSTTDYNETTTAGNEDHLGLSDLSATPSSILAVKPTCYCTGDGTLTNMRTLVESSGTTAYGTNQAVSNGTYSTVFDFFTVDPNGSIAWTAAAVNAMLSGYEANT